MELGIRAEESDGGSTIELPSGIPPVRPGIEDLAVGLLAQHERGADAVRSWAVLVLGVNQIDFASFEAEPDGDMLLEALWDAAGGHALRETALRVARRRVGG